MTPQGILGRGVAQDSLTAQSPEPEAQNPKPIRRTIIITMVAIMNMRVMILVLAMTHNNHSRNKHNLESSVQGLDVL